MSKELTNLEQPVARIAPGSGVIQRFRRRARELWVTVRPLMQRAISRIRAAKGWRGKVHEIAALVRKANEWLHRSAAITAARQHNVSSARLSDFIVGPTQYPECRPLGGGMLAIALQAGANDNPGVTVRDRYGNIHSTRIIERIAINSEPSPAASASARLETTQIIVQTPRELFESSSGAVDVQVEGVSEPQTFRGVVLDNPTAIAVTRFSVENNLVLFAGTRAGPASDLTAGLFVDGKLSVTTVMQAQGSKLVGSILLGYEHFDGALHHLEIRELASMAVLASAYQLLPLHITPWNTLQTYAGAPLDGTLSPLARHHFRAYRLWLDRLTSGRAHIPPIAQLYSELLHGFRKRREYPHLDFPVVANPVASIIIPVHDKFEITYLCLCSLLFAYNDTPFEVIVVDDASTDETRDMAQFVGGVRILRRETNGGFVDSCNDGARLARGEFIVFLNNDIEATARWLDELVLAYRSFDAIGLLGSKLVYPDGRLQEAGGIIWRSGDPWNVGRGGSAHDPRYNYLRETDYVSGAAMMLPREVWKKVGGFSVEFAPGYFEDTDLAMKVRDAGYRVVYVPTSTIIHYEGESAGTDTASGMKRFQEVNRPKFKRKWSTAVAAHGVEGEMPDREKDRAAVLRVLFLDHQFPSVDSDAGSYAAFQEIRLLQNLGAKVTFLPRNLAWMDRHTLALQRIGVECLYAPYVTNYAEFIRTSAKDFDMVFICRHQIAEQVVPLVRAASPSTKILFNLADLHFLRELREAAANTPGYTRQQADATRATELAVVQSVDLSFSYSDVELAILESHLKQGTKTARLPWIVEPRSPSQSFCDRRNLLFLGGFVHPPNAQAVKFFAGKVMPALRARLTDIRFDVVGRGAEEALKEYSPESVHVIGYVADLDEVLDSYRIFVAPLLTGAGLKGKVIEAISRGVPCVLSPVAAEGTGLVDGISCLVAESPQQWVESIAQLYTDETLWSEISGNALKLARAKYSFERGARDFANALRKAGIGVDTEGSLVYRHVRPWAYGL